MTKPAQLKIGEVLWQPNQQRIEQSNIAAFLANLNPTFGVGEDYDSLYRWSIAQPADFWSEVWRQCGVISSKPCDNVLVNPDAMPGAKWFDGARLNYAENLLRYRDQRTAIIFRSENGNQQEYSYAAVYDEVARYVALLQHLGVTVGDRVAGYMANAPEAIFAMLASASIGAIWSSCSPDFGVKGVLERFSQINPKVLFAIDAYQYNGREHDVLGDTAVIATQLDSVQKVVIVPFINPAPDLSAIADAMLIDSYQADVSAIEFAQLPFEHPLYILYSSGTTGAPKCIVHGAGGTLLQHLKEHRLHCDIGRYDRLFYFTTCGWMMWNWLASGLASGCTLVLYDGSPFLPRRASLWQFAQDIGITIFGTSARYIAACAKAGLKPQDEFDLTPLRAILSTGSPLAPESFDYVYNNIKSDLMLASICGGTDIVSCFVLGNPLRAVRRGEIQCRGLGLAVDVYVDGKPVRQQPGELVCTQPFPCMPIGFWGEVDNSRYHNTYFSKFEGVWAQGDYAEITANDGVVIYGRSDAVLNPGGVRIGTAEIYRQVEKLDAVLESLCIGQIWEHDIRIVLFVLLRQNVVLDDTLKQQICDVIGNNTTRRHIPQKIIAVADIPRTLSGKIVELAVRNIVHGAPVKNIDALANPQALAHFKDIAELQTP